MWAIAGVALIGLAVWWLWSFRVPRTGPEDDFKSLFGVPSDYGRWEEVPR